jgi:hypothetical protein
MLIDVSIGLWKKRRVHRDVHIKKIILYISTKFNISHNISVLAIYFFTETVQTVF